MRNRTTTVQKKHDQHRGPAIPLVVLCVLWLCCTGTLSVAHSLLFVGGACCKWDVTALPMRLLSVPVAAGGTVDACYDCGGHITQYAGQSQGTVEAKLELATPRKTKRRAH